MKIPVVSKVNKGVMISVVAGIALFGAIIWAVRKAPANSITNPVKKVADAVTAK